MMGKEYMFLKIEESQTLVGFPTSPFFFFTSNLLTYSLPTFLRNLRAIEELTHNKIND